MKRQSFNSNTINNTAFDRVEMPVENIQAFQTTRLCPQTATEFSSSIEQKSLTSFQTYSFSHFNLGLHVGDDRKLVLKNRQQLLTYLPEKSEVQWLEQVHGNHVVIVEKPTETMQADAVITRTPKLALAIMTADCLPILLSNKQGTEIAAIHAGWRSLASGIISETLLKMLSENDEIHAWLGPCISQNNFEVGIEVKHQFEQINQSLSKAFRINDKSPHQNKWLGGLQQIAQQQLIEQGVVNIATNKHCTFGENERYYSYRKEQLTGRMAAVICIK